MRNIRKTMMLLVIAAVLLLAVSCGTSVRVQTWAPSTSGISGYKTVAVNATTKYNGRISGAGSYISVHVDPYGLATPADLYYMNSYYDSSVSTNVAKKATNVITRAINQGVYTVYDSTATAGLISTAQISGQSVRDVLLKNGIELLITSKIETMDYSEYITVETVIDYTGMVAGYNFYLNQSASVSMSVMAQDVKTLGILWSNTYSDKTTKYSTLIGYQDSMGQFRWIDRSGSRSVQSMFDSMIEGFSKQITNALTPHKISTSFELMENKEMSENMKTAMKYADDNQYSTALAIFLSEWQNTLNPVAGYNASVMYFALGQYQNAINLANEVWTRANFAEAYSLAQKMSGLVATQQAAIDQINGEKSSAPVQKDLIL